MTHRAKASAALFRAALAALLLALVVIFHDRIELVFAQHAQTSDDSGSAGAIMVAPLSPAQKTSESALDSQPESPTWSSPGGATGEIGTEFGNAAPESVMSAFSEDEPTEVGSEKTPDPVPEIVQLESRFEAPSHADASVGDGPITDGDLIDATDTASEIVAEPLLIPPPTSDSGRHWLLADSFMPLDEANELFDAARDSGYVGSILYRVVEGPFTARADMTRDGGQESIVVGEAGRWWWQFGQFAHKENAERFAVQLSERGYGVVLQGQPEFGPYAHASDAETALAVLRQIGDRPFLAARIVAR